MPDALTLRSCTPPCGFPSVSQLLVGALLRHHRSVKGLSVAQAGQLAGIPTSRVSQTELARQLLSERVTRSLLEVYGAPEEEVQYAAALVERNGSDHVHEAGAEPLGSGAWAAALRGASRETVIFTTGPLQPAFHAAAAVVAPSPQQARWTATLLLHEPALDWLSAEQLAQLVGLLDAQALSVRLVPASFRIEPGVVTQWTLTARGWDGRAAQRERRQLYVAHAPGQPSLVRNGPPALRERQVLEAAAQRALSVAISAHELRQAVQGGGPWAPHGRRHGPAGTRGADADFRRAAC
ncbi:helix-turn-helix transcriptional regulator [Streptomyces misionensis]|uniref:helix-turn-helix domain-containing protein n=1 Tax=Streptomyces misionensis TaxID=67331 RepID=UPI00342B8FA0